MQWGIVAASMLFLTDALAVRPAFADIITGSYMLPPTGDSKVIPLMGGVFDPNPITMGLCTPEDLLIDVTAYSLVNPFAGISSTDLTPRFKVDCMALGETVFSFVAPPPPGTANVDFNNFPDPSGEFSAEVNLTSDPSGMFGSFADALLIISYSGLLLDPNGDGRAMWPAVPGGGVNVRFELVSIPEPASLALAACGLLGLLGVRWLDRRK
jgi:hypothetical protein